MCPMPRLAGVGEQLLVQVRSTLSAPPSLFTTTERVDQRDSQADSEGSIPFTRSTFVQLDSLINQDLPDSRQWHRRFVGNLVGERAPTWVESDAQGPLRRSIKS